MAEQAGIPVFTEEPIITDREKVIDFLRGSPTKFTERYLHFGGTQAWVQVDVYGRGCVGLDHTFYQEVDVHVARALLKDGVVVEKYHPLKGNRLELRSSLEGLTANIVH